MENNMYNHQNDKQKDQIKMDIAPLVPRHRPEVFYMFSAGTALQKTATPPCAGRQYIPHNKAGKSQAQQIHKADQINDKIQ